MGPTLTKQTFEAEFRQRLAHAQRLWKSHVDLNSGELHRDAGGYPDRMPVCCDATIGQMNTRDQIPDAASERTRATLTICYSLPR